MSDLALLEKASPTMLQAIARRLLIENKKALEDSLSTFIRCAWHIPEPATDYLHNWHIDAISEHLMAVHLGFIKRLVINIPPRMMKSLCVTIMYPVWKWALEPAHRFVFSSYSADLAVEHSVTRRNIIESNWYEDRWGYVLDENGERIIDPMTGLAVEWVKIADDSNQKKAYRNTKQGRMQTTSTGGTITGLGGNTIIIDDPHNVKGAVSDVERQSDNDFCDKTLGTRLDDKKKGAKIIVMQRLHEKDYSGEVLRQGGYTHLKIPNPCLTPTTYIFPISKKKVTRTVGQLMWLAREGEEELAEMRRVLGSYGFSGQYGQEPSPADGVIFKRAHWKYYKALPTLECKAVSVDCAFKDGNENDYVSFIAGGKKGADVFLIDYLLDHLDYIATKKNLQLWLSGKHQDYTACYIEDKANGTAIINELKRTHHSVQEVNPEGGKIARARAVSPQQEAGNIWLPDPEVFPESAWWVQQFIENCAKFPRGLHDDDVDAFTQLVNRLMQFGGGFAGYVLAKAEQIAMAKAAEAKALEEHNEAIRKQVST